MLHRRSTVLAAAGLAAVVSVVPVAPATADVLGVTVEGNTVTAEIALAGGLDADLTIVFEQAIGLSAANLGLDAEVVSPSDLSLAARLPQLASIPAAFPVLLTIEPPATGGLSFAGTVTVELYTHDLVYTAGTPLRLFSAPAGGAFRDVTDEISSGSYRVRGSKGDFSELLIVADARAVDAVIGEKLARAEDLLAVHWSAIDPNLAEQLDVQLASARSAWQNGQTVAALSHVEAFLKKLEKATAAEAPNVWRSARDLDNVGGLLRAAGETLHFSLTLKRTGL
ncbi:MAG TPA: DUF6689 family protein [Thermoanaerobaculia bacterium]|nr:DUF6689 family protein [Thermoanaerobaculia bacterium]